MKVNKILFPLAALPMVLASCDEQVMEWRQPDPTVSGSELPLELAEEIARYDFVKNYMAQYHPNVDITVGMGLDNFLDDEDYRQVVLDNFQGVTFGNAMKHQSIVSASGTCNWSKVDQFLAMNTGLKLHGHNLLWHTQQQQSYIKTLIAPEMVIIGGGEGGLVNIITNSGFEDKEKGWIFNGSGYTHEFATDGHDGSATSLLCKMENSSSNYDSQLFWLTNLEEGKTYVMKAWIKSPNGVTVQALAQAPSNGYAAKYGPNLDAGKDWTLYEWEFTFDGEPTGIDRIGLQFGGKPNTDLYIDDIQFGEKSEEPADPDISRVNLISNGKFATNTEGWGKYNGADDCLSYNADEGNFEKGAMQVVNALTEPSNQWKTQIHVNLKEKVAEGTQLYISYYIKTLAGEGSVRCSTTGKAHYQGDQTVSPVWTRIEWAITAEGEIDGLNFDLAAVPNTYFIDDVTISTDPFPGAAEAKAKARTSRAATITWKIIPDAEKKTILLNYIDSWIKEAMEHLGNNCTSWDVINEPIGDDCRFRGIDGGWMSGEDYQDKAPTESETDGLNLNWNNSAGNAHFYWGYYCGLDYAVQAFKSAAQYSPNGAKLFVNDYNLETNPSKLAKLIEFVNYIDNNGAHVDGIGTQMHVQSGISKEQVDAMFKTLAGTGKLVRITELDVALGTASPSAEQLKQQSDTYQMILTSFFENVPEAQQSAITIWSLSDNAKEHEYWLKDQCPNIFDAKYGRKHAYKGVCDAIAGFDIGADFESPVYTKK